MLSVITTTKTGTRDGREFTIVAYTVGGYTLTRTASDRGGDMWIVSTPYGLPSIVDMADFEAETPKFGVSWSSCGTRSGVDARAYGAQIMAAADVADVFSRIAASS